MVELISTIGCAVAGAAVGAVKGASIGIAVGGPIGAVAGTIPCAIVGGGVLLYAPVRNRLFDAGLRGCRSGVRTAKIPPFGGKRSFILRRIVL